MKIKNKSRSNFFSVFYRLMEYKYYSFVRTIRKQPGIIIIGCGRSGTTHTSKKFQAFGYDVGHERLKKHGISSWYLVSDQDEIPIGPSFAQVAKFNIAVVHQVRHPLKAISSLQSTGWISWKFLSNELPIDFENDLGNFPASYEKSYVGKNTNTRKHIYLSWSDLENEDVELTTKIRELAVKYGYEI